MKFCTKCGKQLLDEATFCTGCGCAAQPIKKAETEPANTSHASDNKRREIIKIILIVVGVVVLLELAVVVYYISSFLSLVNTFGEAIETIFSLINTYI